MRVLHVSSSFPRHHEDHVGTFVLDLAAAQAAAGLDVTVLAPHDRGAPRQEHLGEVRVRRFRYAPAPAETLAYRGGLLGRARTPAGLLLPGFLAAMAAATRREAAEADLVHAHWWLPGGLAALAAGRPYVVTLHGSDVHLLRSPALARIARVVMGGAALVAVVSEAVRTTVVRRLGLAPQRIEVLRLPVAAGRPDGAAPLPPGPPRVVAAGRLSPEKGFDVLLAAVRLAVADGWPGTVELVGSGPQGAELARLARGLPVALHPAEPRTALWARLDGAHALVVPSRREGLGLVALEALARGRPVITSAAGGLPEVVTDGVDGLLVPPEDPAALAAALRRLPLPLPRGQALGRHDPQVVAAAHRAAYARVLGFR